MTVSTTAKLAPVPLHKELHDVLWDGRAAAVSMAVCGLAIVVTFADFLSDTWLAMRTG